MYIVKTGDIVRVGKNVGTAIIETSEGLLIDFEDEEIGLKFVAPMFVKVVKVFKEKKNRRKFYVI